ncbi:MAG: hypothetical protein IPJ77_15155 [Planctomycetes bacterium]|nr:hypothetical protein [Planctomycetota bacterium]
MLAELLLACPLLLAQAPAAPSSAPPTDDELRAALADAVDLLEPMARRNAANALAARKDVPLERWLELARAFGRFEPQKGGFRKEHATLRVLDADEETDLHLYVPASYDPAKSAPLMLAFHGTGGSGDQAVPFWKEAADALGMLVLGPSEAGKNEGYAFSARERAAALAALRWMRRRFDVDEDRVFATGISRGGHLAWDLALRLPDRWAAIAPMIGSPRFNLTNGQNNLRFLENVVALPIRDLQGSKDDPGVLTNLHEAFAKLAAWKASDAQLIEFQDRGHDFDFAAVDWKAWLGAARRAPVPKRVVRMACETGEARSAWVQVTGLAKDVVLDLQPTVSVSAWKAMDEKAKRAFLQREIDKHTARIEVSMTAPGSFAAKGTLVTSFRLLLTREMFDPAKPVVVTWNGRKVEKRARPDAKVLLQEFVERFDRSFLPVAVVDVP